MRKYTNIKIIGLAAIIMFVGSGVVLGQNQITGEWSATAKKGDKIQLNFERKSEHGRNQHGSSFDISELQGLNPADTANGRVSFRLAREAGTIECEGTFVNGRGSGTFRFVPDMGFVDAIRGRGFDMQTGQWKNGSGQDTLEDRLFLAATLNITTALADDLRSANFPNLDFGDLVKASIFKIDGKFMSEMKATGFPNLGMEDLVKARIFKIDSEFVRRTREMGFGTESFENLVKFSIFKVTPEFLSELRTEGLNDLTSEDVVKLRIFKIDAAYVREARAAEPNITVEQLVQKRIGVRR
ncbi:MAG: hypothetical protein AB7F88_01280 [Pyrinomonadaceae bacterium]